MKSLPIILITLFTLISVYSKKTSTSGYLPNVDQNIHGNIFNLFPNDNTNSVIINGR